MRNIPIYVFFGVPGAGKGSLARLVRERCEAQYLSTGAAMRAWAEGPNPEQRALKVGLANGNLGSDALAARIVNETVSALPISTPAIIFDGFPRNIEQFNAWLSASPQAYGTLIDLPEEHATARIARRLTCPVDGQNGFPGETKCPWCGRKLERRQDDANPITVARRFEIYRATVPSMLDAWQTAGLPLVHYNNSSPLSGLRNVAEKIAGEIRSR